MHQCLLKTNLDNLVCKLQFRFAKPLISKLVLGQYCSRGSYQAIFQWEITRTSQCQGGDYYITFQLYWLSPRAMNQIYIFLTDWLTDGRTDWLTNWLQPYLKSAIGWIGRVFFLCFGPGRLEGWVVTSLAHTSPRPLMDKCWVESLSMLIRWGVCTKETLPSQISSRKDKYITAPPPALLRSGYL